jgi:hypothetical protein
MSDNDKKDKKEARFVDVTLYKDGQLKHIKDKEGPHYFFERGKYQKAGLPLDGEHFEWMLSEYEKTGIPITSLYKAYGHVAPNERKPKDLNTVKIDLPKLVKLDCGLWAAYKVDREYASERPQRDFGLIERGYVWQAQYVSAMHSEKNKLDKINEQTLKELKDTEAVLAPMLVKMVKEAGLGAIELLKYIKADTKVMTDDTWASLYICFPDIHLPGKWPDLPHPKHRYRGETSKEQEKVRLKLQEILRACQSRPGLLYGSRYSKKYAEKIQKCIEDLNEYGLEEKWVNGDRDAQVVGHAFRFEAPTEGKWALKSKSVQVTAENFLAEKDIVDRALRVHSSWFYGPGKKYFDKNLHKSAPPFGKEDLYKTLLDCDAGDATPAFDLVNLLIAVRHLRHRLDPNEQEPEHDPPDWKETLDDLKRQGYSPEYVRLRQVGDLFELWQNYEFLYHGFWVRQTDAGGEMARKAARVAAVALFSKNYDGYQYRKDEIYYDPDAKPKQVRALSEEAQHRKLAKWYTYNPIPKEMLKYRYVVGDMVRLGDFKSDAEWEDLFRLPPFELKRRRKLLADRLKSAREFSLPMPSGSDGILHRLKDCYLKSFYEKKLGKLVDCDEDHPYPCWWFDDGGAVLTQYTRRSKVNKRQEVFWSKLILDLLAKLDCQAVYGNHDGYRGDPLLNTELKTGAEPIDPIGGTNGGSLLGWLSEPGFWFEHGHRWDEYNRDGCAFGSGPTNLGYYWWHNIGARTWQGKLAKTEGETKYGKQEQKCYQAGAALWFLLLRNIKNLPWLNQQVYFKENKVHPFSIYVCGHTHSADLVELRFLLEKGAQDEMTRKGLKEKIRRIDLSSPGMSKERSTAKRYAFDQKDEYERHVAQSGKVKRLPWLKRPE